MTNGVNYGIRLNLNLAFGIFIYRKELDKLEEWWQKPNRKPLVIRGARQVGKSTLERHDHHAFKIDVLKCESCVGTLIPLGVLKDPLQIARYLQHVGMDPRPPVREPPRYVQDLLDYDQRDPGTKELGRIVYLGQNRRKVWRSYARYNR